jgi:hypothetical protein
MSRETWRRLAIEVAHPFRDSRTVLVDLLAGSRVLAGRWWLWTAAVETLKARLERICGSVAAVAVAGWEVEHYPAVGMPVALVAWCAAAWTFAPVRPVKPTTRDDHETLGEPDEDQNSGTDSNAVEAEAAMHRFVEHAIAAAKHHGRHGAHLSELLAALHRGGRLQHWSVTDLGAYLRQIGIPVRDSVRVGKKTRVGVHHTDLRKHLGRAPVLPPEMVPDLTPAEGPSSTAPEGPQEPAAAPSGAAPPPP